MTARAISLGTGMARTVITSTIIAGTATVIAITIVTAKPPADRETGTTNVAPSRTGQAASGRMIRAATMIGSVTAAAGLANTRTGMTIEACSLAVAQANAIMTPIGGKNIRAATSTVLRQTVSSMRDGEIAISR